MSLQLFKRVQAQISDTLGLDALVAGGCIRDHLCNVGPLKDIDVFVPTESIDHYEIAINKLTKLYGEGKRVEGEESYEDGVQLSPVMGVREFTVRFSTPLQIIGYKPQSEDFATDLFDRFDFDINCCGLNSSGIVDTEQARADRTARTLTIRNIWHPGHLLKTVAKYQRLTESKLKNYTLLYRDNAFKNGIPGDDSDRETVIREVAMLENEHLQTGGYRRSAQFQSGSLSWFTIQND